MERFASLLVLGTLVGGYPFSQSGCGYESCPKADPSLINLHLVPHTHDDVGWLKTLDEYYYGSRNDIQDAGVQYILDSVVQELLHDSEKRFIYVETAFFWKWWKEQSDTMRHQVKKLVGRGQLEIIGGGWSMHDEAATHYQSIIDQMTWGFRRLNDALGPCGRPRVGWQIDPFGHSRESAGLMARMGFDGLFLGRIDWEDKLWRMKNKTMEMLWLTSDSDRTEDTHMFTSVLYNTYSAPRGFCFDINCHDEPIIDNRKSPIFNADKRVGDFLDIMANYSKAYRTNNVLVTMGEDFLYMNAHMNFKNMDKLIKRINSGGLREGVQMKAFYSTPSCYLKAVHEAGLTWPTKTDDFFPYSSDPTAFWTGYFTSRPTIKRFERVGNNFLQVCKQLYSLSRLGPEERGDLNVMREAMGVLQHHDAVAGTEKQKVADDYARMLSAGVEECSVVATAALKKLAGADVPWSSCLLLNVSSCPLTESQDKVVLTLYNPLSRSVTYPVRLPVSSLFSYTVSAPTGKVESQIVPVPDPVQKIPGRPGSATSELVFIAQDIPPLGFKTYFLERQDTPPLDPYEVPLRSPLSLGFKESAMIVLNGQGRLKSLVQQGQDLPLQQDFFYYRSAVGNNEVYSNRSSGAYIFRPNSSEILISSTPKVKVFRGSVVEEVHQEFNDWVSQVIRVYQGLPFAEFEWLVGPIPVEQGGKELITRYSTSISSDGFFTDSNGREMLNRKLNFRPSWPVMLLEPVPGNYYPVTTAIAIEDSTTRLTVLPDRAEGGTSLKPGQLELMLHRRLTHDDAFGVGEALNEKAFGEGLVARGSHWVAPGPAATARKLAAQRTLAPWLFLTSTDLSLDEWASKYTTSFQGSLSLPENVHILTFEPWTGKSFILRLEHIMELSDGEPAQPVILDLATLFTPGLGHPRIISAQELRLGANEKLDERTRFVWKPDAANCGTTRNKVSDLKVTLNPMDIKTFQIEIETSP